MEHFPLNKAHQLERRADALERQRKYDECIECHRNVIKYLYDTLNLTEDIRAQESIQLQIDHNHKQIDTVIVKKQQYEEHKRRQHNLKQRTGNLENSGQGGQSIQNEIFRTMETHDSLIVQLMKRGNGNGDEESLKSYSTSDTEEIPDGLKIIGKKLQVDDSTLVEEFRCLSEKLRELVQILLSQLEDKDVEIARLKAEIVELKADKDTNKPGQTLKVVTDSSGATSPGSEVTSPEVHEPRETRELPSLAPLEMPNFDFSTLVKNTNKLNLSTKHPDEN